MEDSLHLFSTNHEDFYLTNAKTSNNKDIYKCRENSHRIWTTNNKISNVVRSDISDTQLTMKVI